MKGVIWWSLLACAPLQADLEGDELETPVDPVVLVIPEAEVEAEVEAEAEPAPAECQPMAGDGAFAGPRGIGGADLPDVELGRALPIEQEWLNSVSNDNTRYHYTVVVPRLRTQWYFIRFGTVVWPATAENLGDVERRRFVSYYVDRTLADAIACSRGIPRRDREPLPVPAFEFTAPARVTAGNGLPITLTLTNDADATVLVALGSPNKDGRDERFEWDVDVDGKVVRFPQRGGRSGRPVALKAGASTTVVADLATWIPLTPGRYDVEVRYALELFAPYQPSLSWSEFHARYHERWDATATGALTVTVDP